MDLDWAFSLVANHALTNRCAVSEDMDRLMEEVREISQGEVLEGKCGEEYLTWVIPPKWTVRKGVLTGPKGEVIANFFDHPMRLSSYSSSYSGSLDLDELKPHIHTDPLFPDRFPYHYRNQYRFEGYKSGKWGFCLSHTEFKALKPGVYGVEIDAEFEMNSSLKVLDAVLPGDSARTILFAAHNCHPGQVNDGLAAVAACLAVHRRLAQRDRRRYTYRFVIAPEFYGAAVFLAQAGGVGDIEAGVYLEDVAYPRPLNLSPSYFGDSRLDRVMHLVLGARHSDLNITPFQEPVGNDEHFYEDATFGIPCLGFNRYSPQNHHLSTDNMENFSQEAFQETVESLLAVVDALEKDCVPVRSYTGPLYQSRHQINIDSRQRPETSDAIRSLHFHMDGKTSCLEIADRMGVAPEVIYAIIDELAAKGLVTREYPGP